MAGMKFKVQQKGQTFLVFNETTGEVRGRFKTEGEAKLFRDRAQQKHDEGVQQVSGRLTPPKADDEDIPDEG